VRRRYLTLALVTIVLGLAIHRQGQALPMHVRDVLGDALWAMMIVWWTGVIAPSVQLRTRALGALALCVAVETSQRYHTPTLDLVRATVPGHLVLGSGFDPRDFVSYAAGVIVAAFLTQRLSWLNPARRGSSTNLSGREAASEKHQDRKPANRNDG